MNVSEEVLIALRKINQAIDLHSRYLEKQHGVTGPQLVVLKEIEKNGEISLSQLADAVSLSVSTITGIIYRLEKKGLIRRNKSCQDKRCVLVSTTENFHNFSQQIPQLLQDRFIQGFNQLEDWEKLMIVSSLQRLVTLMSAEKIDASPILVTGPISQKK